MLFRSGYTGSWPGHTGRGCWTGTCTPGHTGPWPGHTGCTPGAKKRRAATLPGMTARSPVIPVKVTGRGVQSRSFRLQAQYDRLIKKQQDNVCFGDLYRKQKEIWRNFVYEGGNELGVDPLLIVRDPYTQEKPEKKNYHDVLVRTPTLSPTSLLFPFCKHGSTP